MRRDLNTCSSQSTMHHGVPVRVFFRRSSEHHSRKDNSSSTSWSHESHVFSHSRTLVVAETFLRFLYNIHRHLDFARELEEQKKNTEQDQPAVRFIFHLVVEQSIHAETERPRVKKKQTTVYLIKRKMKNKILVYVPVAYMADTKRAAAHRRSGPERGVAAYRWTPKREQTILIGWPSHIGGRQHILIPKPS